MDLQIGTNTIIKQEVSPYHGWSEGDYTGDNMIIPYNSNASCSKWSSSESSPSEALPTLCLDYPNVLDCKPSGVESGHKIAKSQNYVAPTKCDICGDPTSCRHYEVASCNGCKNFFRRTLLTGRRHHCKLDGVCDTFQGKSACKGCRFDRCVLLGMNPRAIKPLPGFNSSDLEKFSVEMAERRKFLLNRLTKYRSIVLKKTFSEPEEQILESLLHVESKFRRLRESDFSVPITVYDQSIGDIISTPGNLLADADKYTKPHNWPLTGTKELDEEMARKRALKKPHYLVVDVFLGIEVGKTFPIFHKLDCKDQEALLRHVLMVNTILSQAFFSCDLKKDTLIMPNGHMPMRPHALLCAHCPNNLPHNPKDCDFLNRQLGQQDGGKESDQSYKNHVQIMREAIFCRVMLPFLRIGLTLEELVLLKAIIYSHSTISELSDHARDLLKKECDKYSKILLNRLQIQLGPLAGARKYSEVISLTDTLFRSAQVQREFHVFLQSVLRLRAQSPPFLDSVMYV